MPNLIEISDLNDAGLAPFTRLTEAQLRSEAEPALGLFIAESPKVIRTALDAGYEPVSLLMERRHMEGQARDILARCPGVPVYTAEREVLAALTGYTLTRGVLCAMRRPILPRPEEVLRGVRRVAVLEGVVDATNVGAIFRSAAALNMDAVLLTHTCCDPLNRRAVRVSMGTVFQIPWTRLERGEWPHPGMDMLRAQGFATVALALREDSLAIDDPRLVQAERLAVLLGAEGDGLAPHTIAACDYTVRIPMSHGVDSLNVAAASAVAFWQLGRRDGH
ncbi:MAG: TrmH family RNA methyltransferase [Gemmiger sp.]